MISANAGKHWQTKNGRKPLTPKGCCAGKITCSKHANFLTRFRDCDLPRTDQEGGNDSNLQQISTATRAIEREREREAE